VPDASVLVLQGFAFLLILASEALRGRMFAPGAVAVRTEVTTARAEPRDVPPSPVLRQAQDEPIEPPPVRTDPVEVPVSLAPTQA